MYTQPEIIVMMAKEFSLNNYRVVVVDAPEMATHSNVLLLDAAAIDKFGKGANFAVYKKSKMIGTYHFDDSKPASELNEIFKNNLTMIGSLKTADETKVAELFNVVKHGNFYDYEHNGVFYPNAVSALKDVISQEVNFKNPFVLMLKPF
jgi:hypothetical protein